MNVKTNYRTHASCWFTRRTAAKLLATVAACAAVLGLPAVALGAEVTTDQLDYSPGATAIITGSGFAPSETVVLQVLHADGTESTGADHDPWSVAADAEGAFTTSWHVCEDDCVGSTLQLTAVGQTSGLSAEAFFTDAVFSIRLTNVVSLSGGCVRTVNSTATFQTFLQVGQTYQFTFLLVTNASPTNPVSACLLVNPPAIIFTVGTNFGPIPVFANQVAPGSTLYVSLPFTVPANACGDTTLAFVCTNGLTRVVQGPFLAFTNTVRLIASLNCSNAIACTGAQPPTITCPPPVTRSSSNACSALVFYPPPSFTGIPAPVVTCVPPSGSIFPVGNTTVTCTAVNSSGTASCSFIVRVVDSQRPTIHCPANTTVQTDPGRCSRVVPFIVGASDNCSNVTVICSPPSGTDFPKGSTTIFCIARDPSSNAASCAFVLTVVDEEPPVIASCAQAITVSAGANCQAAVPDVTGDVFASDNCTPVESLLFSQDPPAGTLVGPGQTTITVTVTDTNGNVSLPCTTDFIVVSSAPVITALTGPSGPLALGSSASVTVDFTDADINQSHTVVFDWDDGTSNTVSLGVGAGTATQTHTYAAAGVFTVNVTVSDPCASTSQEFQFIVIFDPNAGFVTGGGWIQSPAGAYTANPSLTGRANFGFVSMYHQGASLPTGQTEFHFELGDLNFHSTDYEWLVVAGPKAQYKGTGTVNGAGSYKFLLTARDGEANGGGGVDKFRIKIWNDDGVIYDNVLGTSDDIDSANPQDIQGGNIVIHK